MSHPVYGTAPIRCGRMKCGWRGFELDRKNVSSTMGGVKCTQSVCPTCGCDSYMFMTAGEIKDWERRKARHLKGAAA